MGLVSHADLWCCKTQKRKKPLSVGTGRTKNGLSSGLVSVKNGSSFGHDQAPLSQSNLVKL